MSSSFLLHPQKHPKSWGLLIVAWCSRNQEAWDKTIPFLRISLQGRVKVVWCLNCPFQHHAFKCLGLSSIAWVSNNSSLTFPPTPQHVLLSFFHHLNYWGTQSTQLSNKTWSGYSFIDFSALSSGMCTQTVHNDGSCCVNTRRIWDWYQQDVYILKSF